MQGGTIAGDVYGGGEVGSVRQSTDVALTGGTIEHDAYGGGKGTEIVAANVGGDATLTLNGTKFVPAYAADGTPTAGRLFGCNNVNGTPKGHAKVHVFKTVPKPGQPADGYDVATVFGGGNNADVTGKTNVLIGNEIQ